MKICEMFSSIDGEGIRAGYPVTFIRTVGCSLRCIWCDSKYSYFEDEQTKEMSVDEIVKEVLRIGNKRVTLTGGEPLIQDLNEVVELVNQLYNHGIDVNIETNGSVSVEPIIKLRNSLSPSEDHGIIITLDYKCPSSGMEDDMLLSNWDLLDSGDVIKFVVGNKQDLDKMKELLTNRKSVFTKTPNISIFVSPVFGEIEPKTIVEYLLQNNLQDVRIQLQLHKFIWPPEMRGV